MDTSLVRLNHQTETKRPGVVIDSHLAWKPHHDQLCKKLCSGTFAIRRLKPVGSLDVAKVAYVLCLL